MQISDNLLNHIAVIRIRNILTYKLLEISTNFDSIPDMQHIIRML